MDKHTDQATDDASIKPVSSLLSHFEGLKTQRKSADEGQSLRPPTAVSRAPDSQASSPLVRASVDLPRPSSPWTIAQNGGSGPRTPEPTKNRSQSPPKTGQRRPVSMLASSSPQLTPSVNVESPSSPPKQFHERNASRSPERKEITPIGKVRDLISQHSSRASSRSPTLQAEKIAPIKEQHTLAPLALSAGPMAPPPINRAAKPIIPAKPGSLPAATLPQNELSGLQPIDQRRPSSEARISPFSTPPSSDESPIHSPPTAAAVTKQLQDKIPTQRHESLPFAAYEQEAAKSNDPRSLGFARASTDSTRKDPRTLGFSNPDPQPRGREPTVPTRANTVSDRSTIRDPRELGLGAQSRSNQPRHVSENIRSLPSSSQPQQPKIQSPVRDPRTLGFGASKPSVDPVPEEPVPQLPARHIVKAPPPRPPEESKNLPPKNARQPSPLPDRSTKPGAKPIIARAPTAPVDARFPPPPKRNTDDSEKIIPLSHPATFTFGATDGAGYSSEPEEMLDAPSSLMTQYPDATQTNRRPPVFPSKIQDVVIKSDSRTFALCGKYLCVTGFSTRVFDMTTGEQITGVHHGETVKATAVAFKPAQNFEDEGKRIWIGNNAGDLQELDILTHTMIAENHSHNRREIVQILRHGKELWTLDDDGKLFVWPADESGVPNLRYSPISHRVPRGHTFSLVVQDKLWLATGREIRVFKPGNEASFTTLNKPMSQPGGDVTAGTFTEDGGGRVYLGHADGKVTIYSTKDFSCVGNVKLSDYKINGLAVIGDCLWAAYKTGKLYVYDTSKSPWKVQKDWRAHEGPIAGLVLDTSAFWTMNRLQVTSIGSDGYARFWDGTLEDDWIENAMHERDLEYCSFREIRAAVVSWNAGATSPYNIRSDFIADAIHSEDPPELLVFGFQEVVDLEDRTVTAKSIFGFGKKKDLDSTEQHQSRVYREWRDYLSKTISRFTSAQYSYSEVHTSNLIGLFQCIFIRQEERSALRDVNAANVKCGLRGHYGNKGALVTRFTLDDSTLCFVNCHLAAGQTQTSHRNNDIATILESENLPPGQDPNARMSLFVGGGDGTQILDHEICILNGDLNYRIDAIPRDTVINMIKRNEFAKLLERDQIMVCRRRIPGFRLTSFVELPLTFAPTYKYDVGTDNYDSSEKKRAPAWCDRLMYRGPGRIKQLEYVRHEVRVSDHRPVSGMFKLRIKTIDPKKQARIKDECHQRFAEVKKALAERASQRYLVNELGVSEKEAKKLIAAS